MEIPHLGLRALQFLWTLLITALISDVISDAFSGNPSSINYAIFVAVLSWLVLLYGIAASIVESLNIPIVLMIGDALLALFTLIAGIVLAAKLHVHSCGNYAYTTTNSLTNGSNNPKKRCHELQASTAFFWFLWVTYMATLAFSIMNRNGGATRGGVRKGPVMTQV